MKVTVAELLGHVRPRPSKPATMESGQEMLLWLRDGPDAIWLRLPGADELPPHVEGAEVLEGDESLAAIVTLLEAAGEADRAVRFDRQVRMLAGLGAGRLASAIRRLEEAISLFESIEEPGLEEVASLLGAWAHLMVMLHGRDAVERFYERHVKTGHMALHDIATPATEFAKSRARRLPEKVADRIKRSVRRTVRHAKALLRALRKRGYLMSRAEYAEYRKAEGEMALRHSRRVVVPVAVVKPVVKQAEPAPSKEQKEPRLHKRGEKKAAVEAAKEELARKQALKKIRAAEKEAARKRAAVRRGIKEALRRKKAAVLKAKAAAPMLPQLHAALVEALRWGAVRDREVAVRVLESLRGHETDAAAIVQAIDGFGLHDLVSRLAFAFDAAAGFEAVVGSASDGGRDAEQRLLVALEARGVEVHRSQKDDRKAGVDAFVIVDGVGVCLQLTTMNWLAATTPTKTSAMKRLVNGQVEVGEAVSKIQKDIEKFRRHYGDLPYVVVGVNVRMPFTPEQYADDVLALIRQASEVNGAVVAFVAAPGAVTYEEVM
ncbi:MAG: hypothetical protein KatS3mg023_3861 [Armatimonadota bacterium]|nr:MAG: hypothetical protein KatS3mg023_3861 [Armatimonadota bacterium]